MFVGKLKWEVGTSGTLYCVNEVNGRVVGTVSPLGDAGMFKVVESGGKEFIYEGEDRAKKAVEATSFLV